MHRRQKIGLALGAVAAIVCGGHILLSVGYVGDAPVLGTWRDQPLVNVAGLLIGAVAMYLAWFGTDDGFFRWNDATPVQPLSINGQVRAGIYLHALMTAFLLVVTSLLVGVGDPTFGREMTISWIADGALWALQGSYWLIFGSGAESRQNVDISSV